MHRTAARLLLFFLFLVPAVAGAEGFVLFAPTRTSSDTPPASPAEGILTQKITVQRGDTLKKLSRRYSGRASYFPQILLFNRIPNPDRIRTGESLLVPVSGTAVTTSSRRHLSPAGSRHRPVSRRHRSALSTRTRVGKTSPQPEGTGIYRRAVAAYRRGDLRQAIGLFDRFIARHAGSPLAADAHLYRADCYLRLSGR